jgi:hypothetical protein
VDRPAGSGHGAGPPPILSVDTPALDVFERPFDLGGVQRSDLGYKRLYSRCWNARLHNDLPELLALASESTLSPDMLATIAPNARDHDASSELIHLVLDHPSCSEGVAGRFATHPDPTIRLRVATFPGLLTSSLAILAIDADDTVRAAAVAVLTERASTMTGD